MKAPTYIAVEGPIGVGKTTFCKLLAADLKAKLVLEEASENPFLGPFYDNPDAFAFQTQIFFLLSRYRQQIELKQQELFTNTTVCDYIFGKDQIFASLNLTPEEMDLYDNIYQLLDARLPRPDLVIFLQASPDILLSRIKKRKIAFEKGMSPDYIEELSQAYSQYFFQYTETPLLVVNTSGSDFVKKPEDFITIKNEILSMWEKGLQKHYVTIDSR